MELVLKIVIILTMLQRLYELRLSKKNEKILLSEGAKIIPEPNYIFMVLLHTSWILYLIYSAFFTQISTTPIFIYVGLFFFFLGQILRITAIKTLGYRWSTRIVVLPKAPVIQSGIFNKIRHPNYLGVVLEIAFLPIALKLFNAAIIFSVINAIILFYRIRLEEKSLYEYNNYFEVFNGK